MTTETESHEFIGWYEGYHAHDAELASLRAEIERLREALSAAGINLETSSFVISQLGDVENAAAIKRMADQVARTLSGHEQKAVEK